MKGKHLCANCGGELGEKRITVDRRIKGELVVFMGVLAEVCKRCGAQWFSLDTARAMDEAISRRPKPARLIKIPVYDLRGGVSKAIGK